MPVLIVLTEAADTGCWEAPDEATAGDGAGPRSVGAAPAGAPLPALCPRRWGGKKEKGRAVTSRQPRFQLIFDELIDNKTKKVVVGFEGVFAFVDVGGGFSGAGKDDLCCLSICQALSQRSAREERVINRLEVISDVSVFLPCFQVIMFAGSRPPGSLPSY